MIDGMLDESIAGKMVKLFTEFPCAGTKDADFSLDLPLELSKQSYEIVVKQIEFRRKCMNQGFDNLLELLKMHFDGFQEIGRTISEAKADDKSSS